jgi:hypothetical protein
MGTEILAKLSNFAQIDSTCPKIDLNDTENVDVTLIQLGLSIAGWRKLLPVPSSLPQRGTNISSDPSMSSMKRCLAREVALGTALLEKVLSDFDLIQ